MSVSDAGDAEAIAEKVTEELELYQQLSIEMATANAESPEAVVKGLVRLHLSWTEENPDTARLIGRHRNEVINGPQRDRLMASNARYFKAMKEWIDLQANTGRLPAISFNLMHAVIFAPTQEVAKLWLAGRLKKPLADYIEPLGDAAWAGVLALPERQQPGPGPAS